MTDRDMVQFIFRRDRFTCYVCGESILGKDKQPQRAHLLSQGKNARRVFAKEIIDSPYNAKATCSLKCNNRIAINHATQPVLVEKLTDAILSEDMAAIDELLKHRRKLK